MSPESKVGAGPNTPDFSFLGEMKGLRVALNKRTADLGGLNKLEEAEGEVQRQVVLEALSQAEKEYKDGGNGYKLKQVGQVREGFESGKLTFSALLQGLEPTSQSEKGNGGVLGRIRAVLKI